jgi:DinB superfamily
LPEKQLTVEQVLTLLTETPQRITELTAGVAPTHLDTVPEHGGWSASDVLSHLRSCSDVWGDCMRQMLDQNKPTLRAVNPTTWINQTNYPELKFQNSFRAYSKQRVDLLSVLKPLTPKQWARSATITGAGKPLERTVFFYARWLATHERTHLKQIKNIVNPMREQ